MEEVSFGRYINMIGRKLHIYNSRSLKKYDISAGKHPFLMEIYYNEGICQERLSKILNVDKTTSTKALKKLMEKGYIEKIKGEDKRFYKLFLTPKGKSIIPGIKERLRESSEMLSADIEGEDKEKMIILLDKMLNNINTGLDAKLRSNDEQK